MTTTINASNSGSGGLIQTADASGVLALQTAGVTAVTINASQNVGIGTASPADKLHVAFSSGSLGGIRVQNTNSGGQAALSYYNDAATQKADIWWNNSGSTLNLRTLSTDPMVFSTNNAERMRIDSSGNVLVGATSGGGKLSITGTGANGWVQNNINSGTASTASIVFTNDNGAVGSILTSGSTTTYSTSSDYRLKEDIAPMTGALAKVAALKPVTYKWKVDGTDGQGFIAHELAEVVPQCVIGEKDAVDADGNPEHQGIDTSFLVATLTAAIQELTARIAALEST